MDTPILSKIVATSDAKQFKEMLRACMFQRPDVYAEVVDCMQQPDDHSEEVYEMALRAYHYATCTRSELQFCWECTGHHAPAATPVEFGG